MKRDETEILIATTNDGKVKELQNFLADLNMRVYGLSDFPEITEPVETGESFAENAALKAVFYALHTKIWSLADDSGLEVDALGGAPGIFSARYGGKGAGDEEKIGKILRELEQTSDEERRARFVCAMAISDETGDVKFIAEGVCSGKIALSASGTNGFGYDPIFIPDGFEQTFGELSGEIKQKISHRARAIAKIIKFLSSFTTLPLDQRSFRL